MGNSTQIGHGDWLESEQLGALLSSPKWLQSSLQAVAPRIRETVLLSTPSQSWGTPASTFSVAGGEDLGPGVHKVIKSLPIKSSA